MTAVKPGDHIAIHYLARGLSGEFVASSAGGPPLRLVAGGDDVIVGVSMAVIGMRLGEQKELQLTPEEAFGCATGAIERVIPANRLPADVQVGDMVTISMAGMSALVWVVAAEGQGFRVRTEHPLAGQHLRLEIKLVSLGT